MTLLFDTHCHLYDEQFSNDLDEVLAAALQAGVGYFVVPGIDVETSKQAIALAERYDNVYAAVGIHPEALNPEPDDAAFEAIETLASHPKVVAIGEIGLDYYWDVAPREVQQRVFERQIQMARANDLPIIIHNRDATEDTVQMIEQKSDGVVGVMHCFTGSWETAKRCIAKGYYISYGGPVTYKNADNVRKTAVQIPDEWLLVETDSPYLSPHPYRGKRNEPARVAVTAQSLAETRNQPLAHLIGMTTANAFRLFPRIQSI